jgi:hypothetical protein
VAGDFAVIREYQPSTALEIADAVWRGLPDNHPTRKSGADERITEVRAAVEQAAKDRKP